MYISSLRNLREQFPAGITIGSVCSGSGLEIHCLEALAHHWKQVYDVNVQFHHAFFCEHQAPLQRHLSEQFTGYAPNAMIFDDLNSLADMRRGTDVRTNTTKALPTNCHMFVGGFSCTSRSAKSSKAASFVNCVQTVMILSLHHHVDLPLHLD